LDKEIIRKGRSFFKEVLIESIPSRYSEMLTVSLIRGRYQLFTDQVIYSFEDLYKNFRTTASQIDWTRFKPRKILLLGLGLGSVIQIVEKKNKGQMEFTAVEIDEAAVFLTSKYTASKFRSPVEYIVSDAYAFVLQNQTKFDLIVFDLFIQDMIPVHFETISFLRKLKSSLGAGGALWLNRITERPDQILASMEYVETVFKKVFPLGEIIDVPPNWVLIESNQWLKNPSKKKP
jgi:spermidine synthase